MLVEEALAETLSDWLMLVCDEVEVAVVVVEVV